MLRSPKDTMMAVMTVVTMVAAAAEATVEAAAIDATVHATCCASRDFGGCLP